MSLSPPFVGTAVVRNSRGSAEGSATGAAGWKKSWMRCASLGVTLGTDASSATEASRTTFAEPSVLSKFVRTVGPTPGI